MPNRRCVLFDCFRWVDWCKLFATSAIFHSSYNFGFSVLWGAGGYLYKENTRNRLFKYVQRKNLQSKPKFKKFGKRLHWWCTFYDREAWRICGIITKRTAKSRHVDVLSLYFASAKLVCIIYFAEWYLAWNDRYRELHPRECTSAISSNASVWWQDIQHRSIVPFKSALVITGTSAWKSFVFAKTNCQFFQS